MGGIIILHSLSLCLEVWLQVSSIKYQFCVTNFELDLVNLT